MGLMLGQRFVIKEEIAVLLALNVFSGKSVFRLSSGILLKVLFSFLGEISETQATH